MSRLPATLPALLADAFATLYDILETEHRKVIEDEQWIGQVRDDPDYRGLVGSVRSSASLGTPLAIREHYDALTARDDTSRALGAYRILRAIDEGMGVHHPRVGASGLTFGPVEHYLETGHYNSAAVTGYVLPSWGRGFRAASLRSHFTNLVVRRQLVLPKNDNYFYR